MAFELIMSSTSPLFLGICSLLIFRTLNTIIS